MDFVIQHLEEYGTLGLFFLALSESVFSPILPDLLLIPLALAVPENAIYYGMIASVASMIGGVIGYMIGKMCGLPVLKRFIPNHYIQRMRGLAERYGAWAVFFGAVLPIPYKFITLSAGMLRVRFPIFILASAIGRAKRFLLEGVLIYYFGLRALEMLQGMTFKATISVLVSLLIVGIVFYIKIVKSGRPVNAQG